MFFIFYMDEQHFQKAKDRLEESAPGDGGSTLSEAEEDQPYFGTIMRNGSKVFDDYRSEYDLLSVKGMERAEIFSLLSAMNDDDRQSVEAYLERAGAWVTLLATERSEEVGEYHLDYAYDTDTHEITDFKALQEEREKANIPIEYGDVVVRISTPDSGEYETIKITNMQSEVQNTLYDILMREVDGWDGNVLDYLQEKGFDFVPIMRSGGLNDGYPQFFDFDMDMTEKELLT